MEIICSLKLEQQLSDVTYNMQTWVRLYGIALVECLNKPEVAVWRTGNCIITARYVTSNTTEVQLIATQREPEHLQGYKFHADEQARVSWHRLGKEFEKVGWIGNFPSAEKQPRMLVRSELLTYVNAPPDESEWKEGERRESGIPGTLRQLGRTKEQIESEFGKDLEAKWRYLQGGIAGAKRTIHNYEADHPDLDPAEAAIEFAAAIPAMETNGDRAAHKENTMTKSISIFSIPFGQADEAVKSFLESVAGAYLKTPAEREMETFERVAYSLEPSTVGDEPWYIKIHKAGEGTKVTFWGSNFQLGFDEDVPLMSSGKRFVPDQAEIAGKLLKHLGSLESESKQQAIEHESREQRPDPKTRVVGRGNVNDTRSQPDSPTENDETGLQTQTVRIRGGRPRNPDDEWARKEVHEKGRQPGEVFPEWLQRIGDRAKALADARDSFNKALREKT